MELLGGNIETITQGLIDAAKSGNPLAQKWIIDKIVPNARTMPIRLKLPNIRSPDDLMTACDVIMQELSKGRLRPDEAESLIKILAGIRDSTLLMEIRKELNELRAMMEGGEDHEYKL